MRLLKFRWSKADKQFRQWMSSEKKSKEPVHLQILQSLFLLFRSNLREHLNDLCSESFEQVNNIDFFKEEVFEDHVPVSEPQKEYEDTDIRFKSASTSVTNDSIIRNLLGGDRFEFLKLYENEFPKVVKHIIENSGTIENAKDTFQDALIILLEKYFHSEFDLTSSLGTYLYSISKNLWYEQLRKKKKVEILIDHNLSENITVFEIDTKPDNFEHICMAIESLGKSCKELLERFYYYNQSWKEIYTIMGYASEGSAKNQKYKCLERLRKQLTN